MVQLFATKQIQVGQRISHCFRSVYCALPPDSATHRHLRRIERYRTVVAFLPSPSLLRLLLLLLRIRVPVRAGVAAAAAAAFALPLARPLAPHGTLSLSLLPRRNGTCTGRACAERRVGRRRTDVGGRGRGRSEWRHPQEKSMPKIRQSCSQPRQRHTHHRVHPRSTVVINRIVLPLPFQPSPFPPFPHRQAATSCHSERRGAAAASASVAVAALPLPTAPRECFTVCCVLPLPSLALGRVDVPTVRASVCACVCVCGGGCSACAGSAATSSLATPGSGRAGWFCLRGSFAPAPARQIRIFAGPSQVCNVPRAGG